MAPDFCPRARRSRRRIATLCNFEKFLGRQRLTWAKRPARRNRYLPESPLDVEVMSFISLPVARGIDRRLIAYLNRFLITVNFEHAHLSDIWADDELREVFVVSYMLYAVNLEGPHERFNQRGCRAAFAGGFDTIGQDAPSGKTEIKIIALLIDGGSTHVNADQVLTSGQVCHDIHGKIVEDAAID